MRIMRKRMSVTFSPEIYQALHETVGQRRISQFLEDLARPHLIKAERVKVYHAMSQDTERESEALDWAEALINDTHETR